MKQLPISAPRPTTPNPNIVALLEAFKPGYAKGVDDAERRAKARGEQPAAVVKNPVSAIHLGWDRLDNGQLVATYFLPVAEMAAPKLYTAPQPARQPLTDEQVWKSEEIMAVNAAVGLVMDDLMMLVRAVERIHGIGGEV